MICYATGISWFHKNHNMNQATRKQCPNCGQAKFPFKKGVCIKCGDQVYSPQIVKSIQQYLISNYGDCTKIIKKNHHQTQEIGISVDV